MDNSFSQQHAHNIAPRYPQQPHLQQQQQQQQQLQQHHAAASTAASFYPVQRPSIDVDALAAGVQRYLPGRPSTGYPHNSSYITLPPGVDPATVDFRTFYPYNPSEVKHRKRTTRPQLKVLEDTFKHETKPNAALRKRLAAELEMTPRGVQVWFQNRRAKEKTLAKKAASSTNNGRKAISLGAQNGDVTGDADGDVDRDDGDAAAVAEDDNANSEQLAHPAKHALGTDSALDQRKYSHSSSNSPESTSPELTPPNAPGDFALDVNVGPPEDDDGTAGRPEEKQDVEVRAPYFPPSSWHGPQRSMSRTPTSSMGTEQGREFAGEMGYGSNGLHAPTQDHFMRRPSLPTHLGIGPSRVRLSYLGSPRASAMSLGGGVNAGRMTGYDSTSRRMSLDRLASHPYAHLAAQANSLVYGPGAARFRPSLPATTHSTPTLTPQARTTELPSDDQLDLDGGQNSNGDCSTNSGIPELSLPLHLQHASVSPPAPEVRLELMHRQSLPAHLAMPGQFPSSTSLVSQPQSAGAMSMRFPHQGHVYALSARNYQPPIPGPLPNPHFSFGSVGSGEGEGGQAEGSGTPDAQFHSSLNNFRFPTMDGGKDDSGAAGGSNGLDIEPEADPHATLPTGGLSVRPALYYHDAQGLRGAASPYASRFGSIASTVSIADSESSVTSGACFSSETGSGFDVQISSTGHSSTRYNNARRSSCTGSMMDMFSNLDMQNGSQSSLPTSHDPQKQDQHPSQVPISRSSELALALMPDDDKTSSIYCGDNGSNVDMNMGDAPDVGLYNRASMSSSDLSHGHAQMHRRPLAMASRSAGSSRSSLGVHPTKPSRLPRIETDKLDFMHNYDAVSETGHYSPVSHPSPAGFDYHYGEPAGSNTSQALSMNGSHNIGSIASRDGMEQDSGMMNDTQQHQYGIDDSCNGGQQQQQSRFYAVAGPFNKDGNYAPPHSSPYSLHSHSQENVVPYGYYSRSS